MKRFSVSKVAWLVAAASVSSLIFLAVKHCFYKTESKLTKAEELLNLQGTVPESAKLTKLAENWPGSSTSFGFTSIHPSAEGVQFAEEEYVPHRTIGLPPYQLGLNSKGRVLYVGFDKSSELFGRLSDASPEATKFSPFDAALIGLNTLGFIGCGWLIVALKKAKTT
jgi:hypothetical protein